MGVSIIDVARDAGVSRMTVTRVMRGDSVAEKTRGRVLRSMRSLGYVPSSAARAMRGSDPLLANRSNCFAMVFGADTLKANDFFSDLNRGVERAAAKEGVCPLHTRWSEDADASWLRMQTVLSVPGLFGVLMIGEFSKSDVEAVLPRIGNVVFVDAPPPSGMELPSVEFDYSAGCAAALEHLMERGCERLLLITGPRNHYFSLAMRAALEERAAGFADFKVLESDYTFESGRRLVEEALADGWGFDAVFANDVLCMGATRALSEAGISVPDRVKVMGFDDIPACGYLTPALSSVRLDKEILGEKAVESIIRGARGTAVCKREMIGGEVVVRETTGG